ASHSAAPTRAAAPATSRCGGPAPLSGSSRPRPLTVQTLDSDLDNLLTRSSAPRQVRHSRAKEVGADAWPDHVSARAEQPRTAAGRLATHAPSLRGHRRATRCATGNGEGNSHRAL